MTSGARVLAYGRKGFLWKLSSYWKTPMQQRDRLFVTWRHVLCYVIFPNMAVTQHTMNSKALSWMKYQNRLVAQSLQSHIQQCTIKWQNVHTNFSDAFWYLWDGSILWLFISHKSALVEVMAWYRISNPLWSSSTSWCDIKNTVHINTQILLNKIFDIIQILLSRMGPAAVHFRSLYFVVTNDVTLNQ